MVLPELAHKAMDKCEYGHEFLARSAYTEKHLLEVHYVLHNQFYLFLQYMTPELWK